MNWSSFSSWLREPFPFSNSWRAGIQSATGAALFVAFFLFVFKPFGTEVPQGAEGRFFMICLKFGGVTFLVAIIVSGLSRLAPKVFDEERWVIWKEIIFNLFFIGCIGLANLALAHLLWGEPFGLANIWKWQVVTFAVGIFPTVFGVALSYVRMSRKYAVEAAGMAPKVHAWQPIDANPVRLEGENNREVLTLLPEQLAYLAAADNYVRVYFYENGQMKNQMLRTTMKKMEDALSGLPQMFRCHRTYLVNLDFVEQINGNAQGYRLQIRGVEESIPVSRNLNAAVQERLMG